MYHAINPIFTYEEEKDKEKEEEEEEDESNEEDFELKSINKISNEIEELERDKTIKQLDLEKLNKKRITSSESKGLPDEDKKKNGTKRVINIKIASLEPLVSLEDEHEKEDFISTIKIMLNERDDRSYENEEEGDISKNETASHALLNYFAMLGQPGETKDVDYFFVDALCKKGDINVKDIYNQGIMHEAARDWHTDVAVFLYSRGIRLDDPDLYGRTPLFVAAAANNVEMLKWLLENGANIEHRTLSGEGQCAIHYAARYDAVETLDVLISYNSSPIQRDDQFRTPFFVAAEAGHHRICSHFLDLEIPSASYAATDVSIIDEIVENLPTELADRALNQFYCVAHHNMSKVKLYMSPLGKKRARLLGKKKDISILNATIPASTLELIARRNYLKLIPHPIIQQLIRIKESFYGDKFIYSNIVLNIVYTFLWTIAAATRVSDIDDKADIHPSLSAMVLVLITTIIAQFFAFFFMFKLYKEYNARHQYVVDKKKLFELQNLRNRRFCHPRWLSDEAMLEKKKDAVSNLSDNFWQDGWVVLDVFSLVMATAYTIITILWFISERSVSHFLDHYIRIYFSAFFILVVWIRLNRCFKMHKAFGAFVAMLGECLIASYEIGFLFLEFFIPFSVTFWVLFGGQKGSGDNYTMLSDLVYQLYLLSIVGDYDFDTLKAIHYFAAKILVGLYLVSISIITINLYIALLSEAFSRVIENASNRADLEKALFFSDIERIFPETNREFEMYLNKYCSPLMMEKRDFSTTRGDMNMRAVVSKTSKLVIALNSEMIKVARTETNMKRDLGNVQEKFREFREDFPDEKVDHLKRSFIDIVKYQSKPYVRAAKKTNDNIVKCIRSIKHGGKYI